ncbi:MAG: ABC transporter permease [Anaerolineales bacterium]|uniref:ABC transporter permease n=1 Tax=Candidatus Villigracilis proximus TaxID=3140683 RepID=UPI003135BC4F|nr:ABC transporter permease [Anaerolineales bacterium]
MNNLVQAIWVEFLKARRSKVPLFTALGFAMIPLGGGFFMIVLKDPEMARRVGLISMKANLTMGTADWNNYFQFLIMAVGAGGLVLFGVITSWVFGREYSDHTIKDLFALPTSRSTIVMSKCIVVMRWSFALTIMLCLLTFCIGTALSLPPKPRNFYTKWNFCCNCSESNYYPHYTNCILGKCRTWVFTTNKHHNYCSYIGATDKRYGMGRILSLVYSCFIFSGRKFGFG